MNLYDAARQSATATETVSVLFTDDELWLLQRYVRHELAQQEQWKFPPAGLDLNDQITAGVLLCTDQTLPEAALRLSLGDLLVLDYCVPADAKDINGKPLGRSILLKSYRARAELRQGLGPNVDEPEQPSKADIRRWVENLEVEDAFQRRYQD